MACCHDHSFFLLATPRITSPPQNQTVNIGGSSTVINVTFTCAAYAIPVPTITWQHTTTTGRPVNISSDQRITIDSNVFNYNRTSTLTISDVQFTDRGQYTCTATNDHSSDIATAILTVIGELGFEWVAVLCTLYEMSVYSNTAEVQTLQEVLIQELVVKIQYLILIG